MKRRLVAKQFIDAGLGARLFIDPLDDDGAIKAGGRLRVLAGLAGEAAELPGAADTARFIRTSLSSGDAEAGARAAVGRLALLAAAAALRESVPAVAELFARTRLADRHGALFGTSDLAPDEARFLLDRALPAD